MPSQQPLPRVTPEEVGIAPGAVVSFLEALRVSGQEIHSFMLVRRGSVAAEAWWKPYAPELPHTLYSLSKSFTSTAVGFAVSEGLLTVDQPVVELLPEDAPKRPSKNLRAVRVRHLLSMCTGHAEDTLDRVVRSSTRNWARGILRLKVENEPGSLFVYNNGATYLLSAIVQKLTGQRLLEYLTPRLFEPLGIEGARWESCPRGIDVGASGLAITTEDIAKFGLLYQQGGMWAGRKVLSEAWVAEATQSHVQQGETYQGDWVQGYGYQFWRCRHGAYRADGAFGQFCVVMPAQEAVLAITSGAPNMQAILDAVWATLLPAMRPDGERVKVVKKDQGTLRRVTRALRLDPPPFTDNPAAPDLEGATYSLEENESRLKSLSLSFARGRLVLKVKGRRTATYRCGAGKWAPGKAPPLTGRGRSSVPVRCAYTWGPDGGLEATVRAITTPHLVVYACRFTGSEVELRIRWNVAFGPTELPAIRGRRQVPGSSASGGSGA